MGGAAEKGLYDEVLSGKTNIAERRDGEYSAKTEANGDGTKTIYIGRGALAKGSRFGLNVLLAHEAYRNGIDDGEVGQREETDRAVLGHIGAAYALGQTYGIGAIGEALDKEVATYLAALSTGNMDDLVRLLSSYDASGDYWKIIKDAEGKISYTWDGKHELSFEGFSAGDIKDMLSKFSGKRMDRLSDDDLKTLSDFIKSRQHTDSAITVDEIKQALVQMRDVTKYRFEAENVLNDNTKKEKDKQNSRTRCHDPVGVD